MSERGECVYCADPAALPDAICFDMDGTILDWQIGMEESWLAACEKHCDGSYDPPALHEAIRKRRDWFWSDGKRADRGRMDLDAASREITARAFADMKLPASERSGAIADDYRSRRLELMAPYPGAIEAVEALRARGVRLALITNGQDRAQRASVVRFGLDRLFDCVVIEGEFGCGKPDERVFRHALEQVTCEPARAWMVGDNLDADIAPAVALGMHTIWVDEKGDGLPETANTQPHRIVRAISELVEDSGPRADEGAA